MSIVQTSAEKNLDPETLELKNHRPKIQIT